MTPPLPWQSETRPGTGGSARRPLLVAHRAGNEVADVPAAITAGADLVEADVHLYRGRLEVRHTKTMGPLPWLWDRWYLVPASDPRLTLAELVAELPDPAVLTLDLKGWQPGLGRVVAAAMEAAAPGRPYAVSTGRWSTLAAFETLGHVGIMHTVKSPRHAAALPRWLRRHRSDGVCAHRPLLDDPRRVAVLASLAPTLFTWPVDSHEVAADVLDRGVNGLIVDGLPLLADLAMGEHETNG